MTLNALVLGIAVFKALKRSAPIVFADHLVYNMTQHHFWFRFMNTDADELRDVEVRIRFVQPKGLDDTNTLYDTQTSLVEFDYEPSTMVPPLRLFAIKTKSTGGRLPTPQSGDFKPLIVAPLNLVGSSGECIEITIRGYFEATGDLFFGSKRYTVNTIRCGNFEFDVDNNALLDKSDRAKARYLSSVIDRTISTTAEKCKQCPYHAECKLDVALKTRGR